MSGARDQVSRLLLLVPYLQKRAVSLAQVSADFEVTPAQIVKDLRVLWMCGLPGLGPGDLIDIDFEAFEDDPEGVVRIENADYLARPIRLGSTEASALIVALRALRESGEPGSREVIDRTLAKLEEAAAGGGIAPVEVHGAADATADRAVRERLERAISTDRQVRMEYYVPTRDETTTRTVDPLELLSADDAAYLDAWCHLAEARRLFRLDRILGVEVATERRVPHEIAPRDLSEGMFSSGPDDLTARLRLSPGARWVADYYPVTATVELPDGGLEVTLKVADPRWLMRVALRLAPEATVVDPPELAEQIAGTARTALAMYGDGVR